MEIVVKTFCDSGHDVFKKTVILAIFYQDCGHKLRKKSGNLSIASWNDITAKKIVSGLFQNL